MAMSGIRLMLDTNAVGALLKGQSTQLDAWFSDQRCCVSAIVAAEIRYGLERRRMSKASHRLVEGMLDALAILPWDEACSRSYGHVRAELERCGTPLAAMDLLIASHAIAAGCSLVSADRAFRHVPNLSLQSW